jgi:hypothetical protein
MLTLAVQIGPATAQTTDEATRLRLSPAQRVAIFDAVTRDKGKVRPPAVNPGVSVGVQMPPSIELYMLPDNVLAEVPSAGLYQYTIVQDQVVIVDPTTMKVVDVIKR